MNKLDIKPFSSGFIPLSAFDNKEGKLYLEININHEEILDELKTSFTRALAFAVEINYICKDTIKFLIGKAGFHEKVLDSLIKEENKEPEKDKTNEDVKEKKEIKEDKQEDKENTQKNIQEEK